MSNICFCFYAFNKNWFLMKKNKMYFYLMYGMLKYFGFFLLLLHFTAAEKEHSASEKEYLYFLRIFINLYKIITINRQRTHNGIETL